MANIITEIRIVLSVTLLFFPALSPAFFVLYVAGAVSDMIDGAVARRTGTVSGFGSKLDTIADIIFVAVCLIKLLPVLDVPDWLYVWVAVIAIIKFSNIIAGFIRHKEFIPVHSMINRVTGGLLFVLPLTLAFMDVRYSTTVVCMAATAAAIWEGFTVREKSLQARYAMSKYEPLWNWIKENGTDSFKLTFNEIEKIAGLPIDHSFLAYKKELTEYGFMVGKISMKEQTVSFERLKNKSILPKRGG